jgi:hypothetical protein
MPTHALRRSARRLAAAVLTGLTASCLATGPSPADWQAVGFRTPEQTFRTFRTAFATEQLDLEYRCLSDAFRTREGLDGFSYRQLRDRLEQEIPGLHHLSRAEVRGRLERGPDRVALVARVAVLWVERWFLVELVRGVLRGLGRRRAPVRRLHRLRGLPAARRAGSAPLALGGRALGTAADSRGPRGARRAVPGGARAGVEARRARAARGGAGLPNPWSAPPGFGLGA